MKHIFFFLNILLFKNTNKKMIYIYNAIRNYRNNLINTKNACIIDINQENLSNNIQFKLINSLNIYIIKQYLEFY
jgi:hypothetical protein